MDFQFGSDEARLGFLGMRVMVWSSIKSDRVNILWGLTMPFMLQVVMVCVSGDGVGWIDGGEGEEIIVGELVEEGSKRGC